MIECNAPLFGTGEIYHCSELDCPVHGDRNRLLAQAQEHAASLTREQALKGLRVILNIPEKDSNSSTLSPTN